jgi:hypothetical protein
VSTNSGFIRAGYDQTGNAEDANQATAANQPRIVNAGTLSDRASFDASNDSLMISSLTQGSAYLGIYFKGITPATSGITIMFEGSTNYNNVSQSDTNTGNRLNIASRNSTSTNDFRAHQFPLESSTAVQLSILFDRTATGANEIRCGAVARN